MIPAKNSIAAINALRADTPATVFVYQLDTCTSAQFDKLVIAEAFGGAPPSLSEVLLRPQYRQDLLDSLGAAETRYQVSLMHRIFDSGPFDARVMSLRADLARVRTRLKWLRENPLSDDARQRASAEQWALGQLRLAHPDEYSRIRTQMQDQYGVTERLARRTKGEDLSRWIPLVGFPCPQLSEHQLWLAKSHREPFREQVVREIKNREMDTAFDHPLLVQRWMRHLDRLRDSTCQTLDIAPEHERFVSDVDLVPDRDMPADKAKARIGQFRFLSEVYGRKAQAARVLRHCYEAIARWERQRDRAAVHTREAFIAAFPGEYAATVQSYGQHVASQRVRDMVRSVKQPAQIHARKVLPHKAAQFLNRAARLGWDVHVYSPDTVAHHAFPRHLVLVAHQGWPHVFPAVTCAFRRVVRNHSWNTAAMTALSSDGRYWVPYSSVTELMQLLDLDPAALAEVVDTRRGSRKPRTSLALTRRDAMS